MIIIYCEIKLFRSTIIKNGWAKETKTENNNVFGTLFCYAAIPVIRLLFVIVLCIMFTYPRAKMDEWMEEMRNGQSN
jgi:hypothetical protein